jgi:hypothetical protein
MKKIFIFSSLMVMLIGCERKRDVRVLQGHVVYILPDKIRFVETRHRPDGNYTKNLCNQNFNSAIIFTSGCEIERQVAKIKADALFDENPEIKKYTTFLKQPLVFPAEIMVVDTTYRGSNTVQKKVQNSF